MLLSKLFSFHLYIVNNSLTEDSVSVFAFHFQYKKQGNWKAFSGTECD